MEDFSRQESREKEIERLIEELAIREEMSVKHIQSDMVTFCEILADDEDAKGYFDELEEKTGVPASELIEYAKKLNENP